LAFDGFEVLGLCWFVKKGLEIRDKLVAKVTPVVDAMARKMSEPLQRIMPKNNGQVRYHDVLHCLDGLGGGRINGQPAARILLGSYLSTFETLKLGGH
jgi:hypothetical protein